MPAPIRVLHVEDNREFASMTKTWLERRVEAITVERVPKPADGLGWLADSRPDCIVSDYQMPGMTGIEFLGEVRETDPNLPFILFTSKESETVATDAIDAGVTDYLQKDTGMTQYALLAHRIEHAVGKRRAETDYRSLLDNAPEGIAIHDSETGVVVDANARFCTLIGHARENILDRPAAELSAEASDGDSLDQQLAAATHSDSETGGDNEPFDWTIETSDGDRRTVEVTLATAEIGGTERVLSFVREH